MKKIFAYSLCLLALLSCDRTGLDVTDNSFKFKGEVSCDEETYRYSLFLSLTEGSRSKDYEMVYSIDDDPSLSLCDDAGREVRSGAEADFRDSNRLHFLLPALRPGNHKIHIALSSDEFSSQDDINFEIRQSPLSIHTEVNTSRKNPNSMLLVSLQEGLSNIEYKVMLSIDGKDVELPQEECSVDFSKTPIYTVTIPTIRPGKHEATITLNDGQLSRDFTVGFEEPVRFPYLDLTVRYDEKSGKDMLTVSRNPYGIHISVSSLLTVTGSCTYWLGGSGWDSYPSPYEYQTTKTRTLTDQQAIDTFSDGEYPLSDRDTTVESLMSLYEMSAVWAEVCDSEYCYWIVSRYEPKYYKLTSETLAIDCEIESVPGITARISGSIADATWNGEKLTSTPISINL